MPVTLAVALEEERLAALLTVDGLNAGVDDTFTIERQSPSGTTAGVRGAIQAPVDAASELVRDYEIPLDTPVTYTVTVYDGTTVTGSATAGFEIVYQQCDAWLVDLARPTNSLTAVIQSLTELAFDAPAGVHRVLNRRAPIMTTLPAWTPTSELIVLADTLEQRDRMRDLFGSGYPFLLRTTPSLGIGNLYLGLSGFVEERILTDGYKPERRFRVACVQVERPDPATFVPIAPNTYQNVQSTYPTYADLLATTSSYDEVAYTYPGPGGGPIVPWPPDDI